MVKGNSKMLYSSPSRWDIPILAVLVITTVYLEGASPHIRPADLSDPSLKLPHAKDVIPARILVPAAFFIPLVALLLLHIPSLRTVGPLLAVFTLGLFETNVITVFLTNILKLFIGRPRPYFASVCEGYAPHQENLCTGDAHAVAEARKSFPSGHSSLAFSAGTYLALYLALKLRLSDVRSSAKTARMLLVLLPVIAAGFVAASRTVDYHHHYADVVAGSVLGAAMAAMVFSSRSEQLEKIGEETVINGTTTTYEAIADEVV